MFAACGYELVLRATEKARRVCHVPRVLCHRRLATVESPSAKLSRLEQEVGRKALIDHCQRIGLNAEVLNEDVMGHYRIRRILTEHPKVSIIVFYEGDAKLLATCIESLYKKIEYQNFEVLVVDAGNHSQEDQEYFKQLESSFETFSLLTWDEPINRSKMANYAITEADGEFFLFLNSDACILSNNALDVLLG